MAVSAELRILRPSADAQAFGDIPSSSNRVDENPTVQAHQIVQDCRLVQGNLQQKAASIWRAPVNTHSGDRVRGESVT